MVSDLIRMGFPCNKSEMGGNLTSRREGKPARSVFPSCPGLDWRFGFKRVAQFLEGILSSSWESPQSEMQ